MREIITKETLNKRKEEKIIERIMKAGYFVKKNDIFCYIIKKERGLFKPKLIIGFWNNEIRFDDTEWIYGKDIKKFIKEFENKTKVELVRYI